MNTPLLPILSALIMLQLAACQRDSTPTPTADTSSRATSGAIKSTAPPVMTVDPATMAACDPAATALVKWDVRNDNNGSTSVGVWVGKDPAQLKLFASGGAYGQARTGAWTRPGTRFQLKNSADGKVLGEVVVGGPYCAD